MIKVSDPVTQRQRMNEFLSRTMDGRNSAEQGQELDISDQSQSGAAAALIAGVAVREPLNQPRARDPRFGPHLAK